MPDRLTPLDASFLYLEQATTPMHVGSVMVFERPSGPPDHAVLLRHVAARIAYVPRYRQRVRPVPGRIANPVWVDDEQFDVGYHVRHRALPRPGSRQQLEELVAGLLARHLDPARPLWQLTLVEGLDDGERFAVVTKVHQALVDGVHAVDLGQVVLDESAQEHEPPAQLWHPAPEPGFVELVAGAVADSVRAPRQVLDTLRTGAGGLRAGAGRALEVVGGLAARTASRPTPRGPLNPDIGEHRRFRMVGTDLADYRAVRGAVLGAHGAGGRLDVTVNDVVLATLAGGLRSWLLARGEPVRPSSLVRALVPMSVRLDDPAQAPAIGSRVSSILVDLPTGEASPLMRLHQVAYATLAHREAGQAVDARTLAGIAGFAPPTLHSLGARVASGLSRHLFNLVVTNVPGPQRPRYLHGARMLASCPVIPLAKGQALSVGLTSYDGGVHYGLFADRDAMPDLEVLGQCLVEALAELVEAVGRESAG